METKERRIVGKQSRAKGLYFEKKTRIFLENKNFIISKWQNNVDLEQKKIIPAKHHPKFQRGNQGFPDFIAITPTDPPAFVECKRNGLLSKNEKLKLNFLKSLGFIVFLAKEDENRKPQLIEWR